MYETFYHTLYRIRRVEEEIARLYPTDKIKSPVHLAIGQEAISVGVCAALAPTDIVFGTYRSHALYLAKGGDLKQMLAEMYGKATGSAKGKGGSMHLIDRPRGVMGASAVVATTIPNAVGYAYALKLQKKQEIVVSFFGDGAVDEGVFHESMNFAALKALAIIFICENNFYAIHTHQQLRQKNPDIAGRAQSYGMPAQCIKSNNAIEIYEKVHQAVQALRCGEPGPYFFECWTYRWKEHVGPGEDYQMGYRTQAEAAPWRENDEVKRLGALVAPAQRAQIEAAVEAEIAEAIAFAEASPFPGAEELYTDLFKD
ncbi:MAG: thiamine pyrophosphate-dependent dehydrogenase E1 component subunit alpha [Caldilineaceae bacterium]|nr:thiamine pyrophosphate-dependent dehydrogenase E1 component subunit alpha [Caldilineaceae bacterium]